MTVYEATERVSISPIPLGTFDRDVWAVQVERAGYPGSPGIWAVRNMSRCWNAGTGTWDHEPIPSDRTGEWLAEHRYDYDTAIRIAREICGDVEWNGRTADQIAARS